MPDAKSMDTRSEHALIGVHPDLVHVMRLASKQLPFIVTEGVRTVERQAALLKAHATQTMHSRHLTGHACDVAALVEGQVRWDWPLYQHIADAVKRAALDEGIAIEWGGDWRTFKDGPHFQLSRTHYPDKE